MQIRVLGGVEATAEDGQALGGPTQRRLLALLVMRAGDVSSGAPVLTLDGGM